MPNDNNPLTTSGQNDPSNKKTACNFCPYLNAKLTPYKFKDIVLCPIIQVANAS